MLHHGDTQVRIAGFAAENMASSHLRVRQWIEAMAARGHDAKFYGDTLTDLSTIDRKFEGCDVVVYGRTHDIHRIVALQAGRKVHGFKIVVDTDDYVDAIPSSNFASAFFNNSTGLIRMSHGQYRDADAVTVSTPYLLEKTAVHNKHCYMVPNCADPSIWKTVRARQKESRHRGNIRIAWSGGGGHYADLLIVKDALLRAVKEHPNVKLIFGNFVPDWAADLPWNRVFFIPLVPYATFPRLLTWLCVDIGIAPLAMNEHNRCKSHVKYIDNGMAGVAGVYQRMEPYDPVKDGLTGLLADSPEEWSEKISTLIDYEEMRRHIGTEARNDIMTNWNVAKHAADYERMLLEIVGRPARLRAGDFPIPAPLTEGVPIETMAVMT